MNRALILLLLALAISTGTTYRLSASQQSAQRRLRDVSHLEREYLPPAEVPTPSREYLPPDIEETTTTTTTTTTPAPIAKLNNEYLPPAEDFRPTAVSTTTEPTTTTTTTIEPVTSTVAPAPVVEQLNVAEESESAILLDDGYHYKRPAVQPDLGPQPAEPLPLEPEIYTAQSELPAEPFEQPELTAEPIDNTIELDEQPEQAQKYLPPVQEPEESQKYLPPVQAPEESQKYLPPVEEPSEEPAEEPQPALEYLRPLEEGVVEAEGPAEDSAVLAEDGYHYRAIKRVRFY